MAAQDWHAYPEVQRKPKSLDASTVDAFVKVVRSFTRAGAEMLQTGRPVERLDFA